MTSRGRNSGSGPLNDRNEPPAREVAPLAGQVDRYRRARGVADDSEADRVARKYAGAIRREAEKLAAEERAARLQDLYGHRQGTPETRDAIERVPARKRQSALARMHQLGKLSADELAAALEIQQVVEGIERSVTVRCASLEARVDNSGSGRDALIESLGRVRLEVSYRLWRTRIPAPRSMIIDMVVRDQGYVAVARKYRLNFRTARKRLISALRMWQEIRIAVRKEIDREDVMRAHERLGEGVVTMPRPKAEQPDAGDDPADENSV